MSESGRVFRAVGVVFALTLASRILGFARVALIASFFGATGAADAFFIAFRIPNLLRKLLSEGILSIAFIPVLSEYDAYRGREAVFELAGSAFRALLIVLTPVVAAAWLWAPELIPIYAPGIDPASEQFQLIVILTRITLPFILFVGLSALSMSVLNVTGHFASPASAPIVLNLIVILALFQLSPRLDVPIYGLAIGIVVGGAFQLLIQVPALIQKGFRLFKKTVIFHPALKRISKLALPTMIGASASQINLIAVTILSTRLPRGNVSYLYYADQLMEFPLGLFSIAAATVILPSLSKSAAIKNITNMETLFEHALKIILFITIPATAGLIVMRKPILILLFERGAFDMEAANATASALAGFCVGLWALAGVRIVVSLYYACQETAIPLKAAFASIIVNLVSAVLLMDSYGTFGLALSASIAAVTNFLFLITPLIHRFKGINWKKIGKCACKSSVSSLIMALTVWKLQSCGPESGKLSVLCVFGLILTGVAIYGIMAKILKCPELDFIMTHINDSFRK